MDCSGGYNFTFIPSIHVIKYILFSSSALLQSFPLWTEKLCRADSDGDGRTNGQELGDPECTWTMGETPSSIPTGHPGICEPLGSDICKKRNKWRIIGCSLQY